LQDRARYAVPVEETIKAMIAWGWSVELDSARQISKTQIKRKVSKLIKAQVRPQMSAADNQVKRIVVTAAYS
jgi:hypothetical protein